MPILQFEIQCVQKHMHMILNYYFLEVFLEVLVKNLHCIFGLYSSKTPLKVAPMKNKRMQVLCSSPYQLFWGSQLIPHGESKQTSNCRPRKRLPAVTQKAAAQSFINSTHGLSHYSHPAGMTPQNSPALNNAAVHMSEGRLVDSWRLTSYLF